MRGTALRAGSASNALHIITATRKQREDGRDGEEGGRSKGMEGGQKLKERAKVAVKLEPWK